jgi:3,4-dihydroxy 2-butanone 4-phosphate synthase / GTP cyclohydrolase II
MKQHLSAEQVISCAREGRMFILVDDEDRENEGDLIIPAQFADDKAVNFMAKYGRGLICLALDKKRVRELNLPPMALTNRSRNSTAFTVSIEAKEGITTGISASDRAHTIKIASSPEFGAEDIVSPGHIFPLEAREGGVLVRAGHTEAAVDIARLAGLRPAAVICEIMNDDGTMARMKDLEEFAENHGLGIGKIADLIEYRRKSEKLIEKVHESDFVSHYGGEFRMHIYRNMVDKTEHVALVKGDISSTNSVLVRVHALDILSDVLKDAARPPTKQKTMEIIAKNGGVLVLLQQSSEISIAEKIKNASVNSVSVLKEYGVGAQILLDLGIRDMVLITNHPEKHIVALEGYGLKVTGTKRTDEI